MFQKLRLIDAVVLATSLLKIPMGAFPGSPTQSQTLDPPPARVSDSQAGRPLQQPVAAQHPSRARAHTATSELHRRRPVSDRSRGMDEAPFEEAGVNEK